jgi:hypothetical protein
MDRGIRGRVEVLRREIVEIQRLNLAYLETSSPNLADINDHSRREQRLREIVAELESMREWKQT